MQAPLTLAALPAADLETRLAAGLRLRIGPFTVALRAPAGALASSMKACYPDYELASEDDFAHAGLQLETRRVRTRPWQQRGYVWLDDGAMFSDYPTGDALPYVEWGINWCIATRCHANLMLHAAVVEKHGLALILPGLPGAGKSTLSSYLAHHGWRLLSDEFCILRPRTLDVIPFPRLVPLKNDAIDVIAGACPGARIGPRFAGTRKGTVAHVTPPDAHARDTRTARAALIVKPQFEAGVATDLEALPPARCFVELSNNAFNYQVLGRDGFDTVAALTRTARAWSLRYSALEDAAAQLTALIDEAAAAFESSPA